jgi:hypothetical protein
MGTRAPHICPICGREAPPRRGDPPNPSFPFCSPACKLVDLGRWLDGDYRIGTAPVESTAQGEGGQLGGGDDE